MLQFLSKLVLRIRGNRLKASHMSQGLKPQGLESWGSTVKCGRCLRLATSPSSFRDLSKPQACHLRVTVQVT